MATPEEQVVAAEAQAAAEQVAAAVEPKADPPKDELGPGGQAALKAERDARKAAEKAAKDEKARADALEAEKLTDTQKLEKRATDAEEKVTAATEKLRRANLMAALADQGLQGARAKAAARLLDGVTWDDSDEPTNLDDALKTARAEYGDDVFKGARAPAPNLNAGEGSSGSGEGPSLTAEELAMAESFGMTAQQYQDAKSPSYQPPSKVAQP